MKKLRIESWLAPDPFLFKNDIKHLKQLKCRHIDDALKLAYAVRKVIIETMNIQDVSCPRCPDPNDLDLWDDAPCPSIDVLLAKSKYAKLPACYSCLEGEYFAALEAHGIPITKMLQLLELKTLANLVVEG